MNVNFSNISFGKRNFSISQKAQKCTAEGEKDTKGGSIRYEDVEIPIDKILCMREIPNYNYFIQPITKVTLIENNEKDNNMPLVTEYEYAGSLEQWTNAYNMAKETGETVNLDFWV